MFKISGWRLWWLFNIALAMSATGLYAETRDNRTLSPYFLIDNGDPSVDRFPLKKTNVEVSISGVIADVLVKQTYSNDGIRPISARYIFPASTRAAVHGMKMIIGGQVITAKIKEREAAQKQFDQAKKEGKSASLLKQQRPNVFSMNLANVMPGDTIDIELRYTELLVPTNGIYQFVYPTVVGPRYSNQPEADAPETDRWIKSPYLPKGTNPDTKFNISAEVSTGVALQEIASPSHETDIIRQGDSLVTVALKDAETFSGNRDFILNFRLAGKEIHSGLMLFEDEEEKFFLLMVQPPQRIRPEDIPPREFIFVIDVSGSMHGFPLNIAKTLVKDLIGNLRATDKFNVILFSGGSRVMAPESVPATDGNIRQAIQIIEQQQGGGGTELLAAMRRGFSLPRDTAYSRTLLVITDGYIGIEKEVFDEIQKNLQQTNVFAFGIGASVNRYLIEGIAKAGQGEPFVVTNPSEAPSAAEKFREYIQSPVLTNIRVSYAGFEAYDIEPVGIHDLFADRPVIVFGKWRGDVYGLIEISGKSGKGEYAQTFYVTESRPLEANSPLRYLWARTRIGRLSDFSFNGGSSENKAEIVRLGLTYNLLTAHTSFIAVSEIRRNPGDSEEVDQPLPLPLHVSNLAVSGTVSVPEPELALLLAIAATMLAAGWFYKSELFTGREKKARRIVNRIGEP
ncbi:MAG TPA: VIT and VWA domain-containing protein [Candidatus Binatia bacterium]|nr:VIT and VWA domain-containing protein [Candidatus Binatia bacterium]